MSLYVAEQDVVIKHKEALPGVNTARSFVKFSDLNRLPLDVVEKIVRDSVAARRTRAMQGSLPTQAELLKLWAIKEEAAQVPLPVMKVTAAKGSAAKSTTTKNGLGKAAARSAAKSTRTAAKTPARKAAGKSASATKAR